MGKKSRRQRDKVRVGGARVGVANEARPSDEAFGAPSDERIPPSAPVGTATSSPPTPEVQYLLDQGLWRWSAMIEGEVRDVSDEQQTAEDAKAAHDEYLKNDLVLGRQQVGQMMKDMMDHYAMSANEEHLCLHFNQVLTYTDIPVRAARYTVVKEMFHMMLDEENDRKFTTRTLRVLAENDKISDAYFETNVEEFIIRSVNFPGYPDSNNSPQHVYEVVAQILAELLIAKLVTIPWICGGCLQSKKMFPGRQNPDLIIEYTLGGIIISAATFAEHIINDRTNLEAIESAVDKSTWSRIVEMKSEVTKQTNHDSGTESLTRLDEIASVKVEKDNVRSGISRTITPDQAKIQELERVVEEMILVNKKSLSSKQVCEKFDAILTIGLSTHIARAEIVDYSLMSTLDMVIAVNREPEADREVGRNSDIIAMLCMLAKEKKIHSSYYERATGKLIYRVIRLVSRGKLDQGSAIDAYLSSVLNSFILSGALTLIWLTQICQQFKAQGDDIETFLLKSSVGQ